MTVKRQLLGFILMLNISNDLGDQNEPFNSIWIERLPMVLEGDFFGERVEATSCGAGGIYQMYRIQRSFTKRYSKSKAFALNLFAKAVLILTSLPFCIPCYKIKFCTVRLTMIHSFLLFSLLLLSNIKHVLLLNATVLATNSEIVHFPAPSAGIWPHHSTAQLTHYVALWAPSTEQRGLNQRKKGAGHFLILNKRVLILDGKYPPAYQIEWTSRIEVSISLAGSVG